jgi:hypothetical protein
MSLWRLTILSLLHSYHISYLIIGCLVDRALRQHLSSCDMKSSYLCHRTQNHLGQDSLKAFIKRFLLDNITEVGEEMVP